MAENRRVDKGHLAVPTRYTPSRRVGMLRFAHPTTDVEAKFE